MVLRTKEKKSGRGKKHNTIFSIFAVFSIKMFYVLFEDLRDKRLALLQLNSL